MTNILCDGQKRGLSTFGLESFWGLWEVWW